MIFDDFESGERVTSLLPPPSPLLQPFIPLEPDAPSSSGPISPEDGDDGVNRKDILDGLLVSYMDPRGRQGWNPVPLRALPGPSPDHSISMNESFGVEGHTSKRPRRGSSSLISRHETDADFASVPKSRLPSLPPIAPSESDKFKPNRGRVRKRLVLPLVIEHGDRSTDVRACPDTGSDDNIISYALVKDLHLESKITTKEGKKFEIANGSIVEAIGEVTAQCSFGIGGVLAVDCVFHVFQSLAVPIIMGLEFLTQTETYTKYTERLVEEIVPSMQNLRINAIGTPRRNIVCQLDTWVACASADTGSDVDLISPQFATSRALNIVPETHRLEFADGSFGYTSGLYTASFSIGNFHDVSGFIPRGDASKVTFLVLENLTSDILLGQDLIQDTKVFQKHLESFIPSVPQLGMSDLNIIRYIGKVERKLGRGIETMKRRFGNQEGGASQDQTSTDEPVGVSIQRENAMREHEITLQTSPEAECQDAESTTTGSSSWSTNSVVSAMSSSPSADGTAVGPYLCTFTGCKAPPFQTQYLLNSHANIHSSSRPHYCPVSGCPRSERGKGFKRKNEMIRHGIIHDSPGYVCPFCPDRDHKYPRPDNLQRHVRVHHVDKDKDDPLLRAVLSQRPDGPNRGRRRRDLPTAT